MSRSVLFDESEKCDRCGEQGAYDFLGDFLCQNCFSDNDEDSPALCDICGGELEDCNCMNGDELL